MAQHKQRTRRKLVRDVKPRGATIRDRGFWAIGAYRLKKEFNFGTVLRNAYAFGASFVFTIGPRFSRQASDTSRAWRHVPVFCYADVEDLKAHLPYASELVAVELADGAIDLPRFVHPERACYLLGAEDDGLPPDVTALCDHVVSVPGAAYCLNLASAGTIVMYDRISKRGYRSEFKNLPPTRASTSC